MTTYRILPSGERRRLPDGTIRAVGQAGPAGSALTASGSTSFAGVATATAAAALVAAGGMTFSGTATAKTESTQQIAHGEMLFSGEAVPSANAHLQAAGEVLWSGEASATVEMPLAAAGAMAFDGYAIPSLAVALQVEPGAIVFGGQAVPSLSAPMQTTPGSMVFSGSAQISISTGALWRARWLDVYTLRQEVLNAIDANNRFLAKQAGDLANANAEALVITNTNVEALDDRVTAEANRITLLTTEVEGKASQTALDSLTSTVETIGDDVTSHGQAITLLEGEIDDKASSQALTALEQTVSTQGGKISANAAAITSVGTQVGGVQASVTEIAEVVATGGSVQVLNPGFESDSGWSGTTGPGPLPSLVYYTTTRPRSGARALRFDTSSTVFNLGRTTTKTGEQFFLRAGIRAAPTTPNAGAQISVGVRWYNAAGGYMSGQNQAATAVANGSNFAYGSIDPRTVVTAPEGAVSAQVYLVVSGLTTGGVIYDDIALERLSETEASARARHTVALNVNGHVSGTVSENDGQTGTFSILAQVFQLIASGTVGMEIRHPRANTYYMRFYAAGVQLLLGINFGAAQNLVAWFGPNVGESACTTTNGKGWITNTVDAYFGGTVTSGVLTASNQSSQVGNITVTTGPFSSNGGVRNVLFGMSYQRAFNESGSPAGSGTISANIRLQRRYGSGSWATLTTLPIVGERRVFQVDPDVGTPISLSLSGSGTYFDTDGGTNPEYRVQVMDNRGWPVLAGAGTQRTYVGSTEYNQ